MSSIAKLFVEVGADTQKFKRGMTDVRNEVDRTANQASRMGSIINTAIGTATGMVATQAINKITETWQWIKKTGEEFNSLKENSQLAFETMLGSGEKATAFLASLQKFAERTPFELPGLIDASQKMIAFGFASEQVLPTLTAIGDAVSGLGGSPEKLQRVITAIGQIKAKGKIQAQEMLQLAEAGIPAWDMLAKAIGVSIPEAMKLSEKGAIDANTAINALVNGMNQKFGGLMEKQSKSFSGLRSTFNDLMRDVAAKVTKPWFENAKKGLERMIAIMQSDKFKAFLDKAVKGSEKLANVVATVKHHLFELAAKGFNIISHLFGNKGDADNTVSLFDTIPKKIRGILEFIKPVGSFIYDLMNKGFKSFTSIFDGFYRSFNKISNERFYFFGDMSLEEFSKGIKSIFNDISSGGKNLNYWLYTAPKVFQVITRIILAAKDVFKYFSGEGLQTTLKKLGSILMGLGATLAKLVRPFRDALGGLFQQLSTMKNMGFADIFKAVIGSIVSALKGFIAVVKEEFWPSIKGGLVWLWNSLWSFITSIDWKKVWSGIVDGFNAIVSFIASIDWANVWSTILSGISAIGSFLKDSVWPVLSSFFDWLLSWFLDTEKRNKLYGAISATWTFISEWAGYLWSVVSPYLGSFFGYLLSWFTDPNKRGQLWNAIVSVWNFVGEWASYLWNWISPYLGSFFSILLSWFTDPTKRQSLWQGIVATWNFVTEWAKYLWQWASPHLGVFWSTLTSWVIDPTKRAAIWQGIVNGWNWLSTWAANIWAWMYPHLQSMYANLIMWFDDQKPGLGGAINGWTQTTSSYLGDMLAQFRLNFPSMAQHVIDLKDTIIREVPLIGEAMGRLYKAIFGEGTGSEMANKVTWFFNTFTSAIETVITQIRLLVDMLSIMVEATKSAFSGDFSGFMAGSEELNRKMAEFWQSIQNQYAQFSLPWSEAPAMPDQHAKGGNILRSGMKLVGENGPELVDLPMGSRVYDHGQSMGKVNGSSGTVSEVRIINDSKFPIDRTTVQEIARALQRELNLQGNRVVFAS